MWPTGTSCFLTRAHAAHGQCLDRMDRRSDAKTDFAEAICLQARLVKFRREDDIEDLDDFMSECLENHMDYQRWDDALDTIKRSLDIVQSNSRARSEIISAGLFGFGAHLEDSRDFEAHTR